MRRSKTLLIRGLNRSSEAMEGLRNSLRLRSPVERTELDNVRRRLELLLSALYGKQIQIEAATAKPHPGTLQRLLSRTASARKNSALAESDAVTIRLPGTLADSPRLGSGAAQYRLLAIEHAERIVRGTAACMPARSSPLERDLYLIAEAVAVDASISRTMNGMPALIRNARAAALAERPASASLGAMEREVEGIIRDVLNGEPAHVSPNLPLAGTPAESLVWALASARRIRGTAGAKGRVYRGVPRVALWGKVIGAAPADARCEEERMRDLLNSASLLNSHMQQEAGASGQPGEKSADGSDQGERESGDAGTPSDEDPTDEAGSVREERAEGGRVQSEDEMIAAARGEANEATSDPGAPAAAGRRGTESSQDISVYPEWDCNARAYRSRATSVRATVPPLSTPGAADALLVQYGPILRSLRQRFERMSARRIQLPRQRDGDELDLAACVSSLIDVRSGYSADDRLYVDVRPARRALAITLLVDVSGSTGDPIGDGRRIIDVERIALLLASEALDALGDSYSILTFSSHGAADVRVQPIKSFTEHNGEKVRSRITAIEPHGKTRLGAAVRHASAQLTRQPVNHRILLILSDGKPNDTDRYFEHYAAEDTRQSILEAKASGVYPFCLTVDRDEGSEYLGHIFGPAGHTILRQPEQLPFALLKGVQHLLAS